MFMELGFGITEQSGTSIKKVCLKTSCKEILRAKLQSVVSGSLCRASCGDHIGSLRVPRIEGVDVLQGVLLHALSREAAIRRQQTCTCRSQTRGSSMASQRLGLNALLLHLTSSLIIATADLRVNLALCNIKLHQETP